MRRWHWPATTASETFLSRRVMTVPRVKNVTSHFTMKTVKPGP